MLWIVWVRIGKTEKYIISVYERQWVRERKYYKNNETRVSALSTQVSSNDHSGHKSTPGMYVWER